MSDIAAEFIADEADLASMASPSSGPECSCPEQVRCIECGDPVENEQIVDLPDHRKGYPDTYKWHTGTCSPKCLNNYRNMLADEREDAEFRQRDPRGYEQEQWGGYYEWMKEKGYD